MNMQNITAEMFIEFNKKQHNHGIPIKAYENIAELLFYFIQKHPFIDGNKRTAAFTLDYYLNQKNYYLNESTKLNLILKYVTDEESTPSSIYSDLKKIILRYNQNVEL
ncbi:MAG: Fic family protein [Candidatus Micrarchaeia archaeon]|jgi:prophage maintenance system killer protein